MTPLWHWGWFEPYVLIPWGTRRTSRGEVLSNNERVRMARTREKRRDEMYRLIDDLYGNDDRGYNLRLDRLRASRLAMRSSLLDGKSGARAGVEAIEGGPLAWSYLTPRIDRMWTRGEITTGEMKASISFCYWYRLGWLMHAPGTNMVKSEKVDGGRKNSRMPSPGATFPIQEMLPVERAVLEAALIRDVPFKDLPGALGGVRITRHRSGRAAFLSALRTFSRLIETLLTK